jgi:hypothetical protein
MMGELAPAQNNLFYNFCLEQQVPANHLLRQISQVLDLGNLRQHSMGLTVLLSTILKMENLLKTELYCGGQNT